MPWLYLGNFIRSFKKIPPTDVSPRQIPRHGGDNSLNKTIMSRIHIMLNVADLAKANAFYSQLLGAEPTKVKDDYVQWKLDDPSVNLSLKSNPEHAFGVHHLGLEALSAAELPALFSQAEAAEACCDDPGCCGGEAACCGESGDVHCCYAQSEKKWVTDPAGLEWELFFTKASAETYHASKTLVTETV